MKRGVVAALSISLFLHGASIGKFADEASTILETKSKSSSPYFRTLYKDLFYVPIWVDENGLTKFGKNFIKEIDNDLTKSPSLPYYSDYIKLKRFLKRKNIKKLSTKDKIDLELKITSLYRKYMNYLIYGGINWRAFDRKIQELRKKYDYKVAWERYPPVVDSKKLLVESVMRGNLDYALNRAEPKRFKYRQLKKYLIKYLDIAKKGGWGKVPKTKTLKPGMSSKAILPIKRHLKLVGDIRGCSTDLDSTLYDQCLAKAVKRFKLRHGLRGNSIIDRQTRKALNIPASYKAKLIRLNLDRIKWFWHQEPRVRIELNIPAFRLYFYEGQNLINTMRVIVGKPDHPTPVFHNVMRYIVVNPYWKIPESIVKKEMLKHLIKDPYYYERQGKYLHKSWSEDSPRVDPGKVNWRKYYKNKKHIPYYFMQVPSAKNALGKIKFLFPNKYSVYIHDTPTKGLFFRNLRAYSHGCMRIQKPRELLETLALYNKNINVEAIMKRLRGTKKKTISLRHPVPIDIVYMTAFVDDYGNLNFRKDLYGYDRYQLKDYLKGKKVPIDIFKESKKKKNKNTLKKNSKKDKKSNLKKEKSQKEKVKKDNNSTKPKKTAIKAKNAPKEEFKVIEQKRPYHTIKKIKDKYEIIQIGYEQ